MGDEDCSTCEAVRFPEAVTFLDEQGFGSSDFELLLSWTEAAPKAPHGFAAGYRLKPVGGGDAFDLYSDGSGQLFTDSQAYSELGVTKKDWNLRPAEADSEPMAETAAIEAPVRPLTPVSKARTATILLPPVDLDAVRAEDAAAAGSLRKSVKRIGVFQALPQPVYVTGTSATTGAWQVLADGTRLWSAVLEAPEAIGQRVHFAEMVLPAGAEVVVYNADSPGEAYGPYTGPHAGESELWSATCFGERVGVELRVPAGVDISPLKVAVDKTVYVYVNLGELPWAKAAGSCNLDVSCYSEWAEVARGVGGLGTINEDGFLWCTGTLLADSDSSTSIPYFLTANHCVGSQATASTLEIYWLYQSSSCHGSVPSPTSVPRTTGGADYLAGSTLSSGTDFALLRLRNTPPSNVTYVGWSANALANGSPITGIHHPSGDYKRISFGDTDQTAPPVFGRPPDRFYGVNWRDGVTEPGSSGSPIFNSAKRVVGQLWGGSSSCDLPNEPDLYGRFDKTYPVVAAYLGSTLKVLRPNHGETWRLNSTETIQWSGGAGNVASIRIELIKGSAVERILATAEPNDGLFSWTIPADLDPGADYRIRVSDAANPVSSDLSDQAFSLILEPEVKVLTPNGGESWSVGSLKRIEWSSLGVSGGTVRIELRKGEASLITIAESAPNTGDYEWILPDSLSVGAGYSVYVATNGGAVLSDRSDGTFAISNERNISVTRPDGDETFLTGRTEELRWVSNGLALADLRIELVDALRPNEVAAVIEDSTPNDGVYEWAIPRGFLTGADFFVRIVSLTAPPVSGTSAEPFAISDCAPDPPGAVGASDGTYDDRVRLQWPAAARATEYRVYRSLENDPETATPLSWWVTGTSYDDYSAEVQPGNGCDGAGATTVYYYWIRSRNECAESGLSPPDAGYRGTGKAGTGTRTAGDTLVLAAAAGALAVAGRTRGRS